MIIKIQLREQNLICVLYKQNYLEMSKDPMIHKYNSLSVNIGDYIWLLYSKIIIHMLTQINWISTFGVQIAAHYVYIIRYYIVKHYVFV